MEAATARSYALFNQIRGLHRDSFPPGVRFWDVVVLTASDEEQRRAYEAQLQGKIMRREIPSGVDYLVYADPPGPRIGCGGATMRAITELTAHYGAPSLATKRILLINAGGKSQRLPSASALGKIFMPLPIAGGGAAGGGRLPNWQVFELKLACYMPLLGRMRPGYLHVPSDTIEVFDVGGDSAELISDGPGCDEDGERWTDWSFCRPGLTAVAHPSSIAIGRTHGVFVLQPNESSCHRTEFRTCIEVLQKPTEAEMRQKRAVVEPRSPAELSPPSSPCQRDEIVYTDGFFFIDHAFATRLAAFYTAAAPLCCEVDAYGDFMRSLGPGANARFLKEGGPEGRELKRRLFEWLQSGGAPLNVVVMNASRFYHIGTMRECTDNLCSDADLTRVVGFQACAFSCIPPGPTLLGPLSRVMHSHIAPGCVIGSCAIVEYSRLAGVTIGDECIVSGSCYIKEIQTKMSNSESKERIEERDAKAEGCGITVPPRIFLHTIAVRRRNKEFSGKTREDGKTEEEALRAEGENSSDGILMAGEGSSQIKRGPQPQVVGYALAAKVADLPTQLVGQNVLVALNQGIRNDQSYVTIVLSTDDDVKRIGSIDSLIWLGRPLRDSLARLNRSPREILPAWEKPESDGITAEITSLWDARLFPVASSMKESFRAAVAMAGGCSADEIWPGALEGKAEGREVEWMSAAEAVEEKDVGAMMSYRNGLAVVIQTELARQESC